VKRRDLARALVVTQCPHKLPEVLNVEEAARLPEARQASSTRPRPVLPMARVCACPRSRAPQGRRPIALWAACRAQIAVLGKLFRRLFLTRLVALELLRGARRSLFQPCIDSARGQGLLLSGTGEIEFKDMAIVILDFTVRMPTDLPTVSSPATP
jgi:hypothetical protein